jgi:hypothetical protein
LRFLLICSSSGSEKTVEAKEGRERERTETEREIRGTERVSEQRTPVFHARSANFCLYSACASDFLFDFVHAYLCAQPWSALQ